MAEFDNPFQDPFQDPSVEQASRITERSQDDYNPFSNENQNSGINSQNVGTRRSSALIYPLQPAAAGEPSPYSATAADLRKRQDELDRKALELQEREEQIQRTLQMKDRIDNFPPLPDYCPIKPCFYQDIDVDIPLEFQKLVRIYYYYWLVYVLLLILNVLVSLAYFIVTVKYSLNNKAAVTFALSLLYLISLAPCSFVCWFRPIYKAFRNDSSFNFFVFFFIFFFQFCVTILQCLSVDGYGFVGIINSMDMFTKGFPAVSAVGGVMFSIGVLFGIAAAVNMMLLIRVHQIYRNTGASFAKAQEELANDFRSSRTLQQAAGSMAASAAQGSINQALIARR